MKKIFVAAAVAAMMVGGGVTLSLAGDALGIKNSKHDLSKGVALGGWNTREEICRVCHAPHDKGRTTYTEGLLWNRGVSQAAYTMYDSSTIDGITDAAPTGNSKLCLACHDGTVAMDTYDSHTTTAAFITGASYKVNTDLQGTHPISITFPATDIGLNDPAVATWADGTTVASTLQDGKVQCSTCHDVHNSAESIANTAMLRVANTSLATKGAGDPSGMCLTCHKK